MLRKYLTIIHRSGPKLPFCLPEHEHCVSAAITAHTQNIQIPPPQNKNLNTGLPWNLCPASPMERSKLHH